MGFLAHVDAGKTTLSEAVLYRAGGIRKLGRVDHQDAFLDTEGLEKERGITIFSKQAVFSLGHKQVTLLDTPGHADFSPEMERTLQVLDYGVLLINAADGVTGQVRLLWKLLKKNEIPTFLFVNKMDQAGANREKLLADLQRELDGRCLDFNQDLRDKKQQENLALCDEKVMEAYLEGQVIGQEEIRAMFRQRKLFPCYFGSALKLLGIDDLLEGIDTYMAEPKRSQSFGARIFKISRDGQGNRLTWVKLTGGRLPVKTLLSGGSGETAWKEKVDQVRLYSGSAYELVQEAEAGMVCALTGLSQARLGEGLGAETGERRGILAPIMTYGLLLSEGADRNRVLQCLRQLEEEEPMLHVSREEQTGELSVQIMGQVQMEILQRQLKDRFGLAIAFGQSSIVYRETIRRPVEGVGHFEPLRHYAEVHLLLEPGEPGSGLQFATACREDDLDRNWQRLILSHLQEKQHRGVLTGSQLTDMKITLLAGHAHTKHTEGGDFRQATYRALRQGLMMADNILLEPVYDFRLELPAEYLGRALSDLQRMGGSTEAPDTDGVRALIKGRIPAASLGNYQEELTGYSRGQGRLFCTLRGYEPCHNTEEVVAERDYRPEEDTENPSASVFCSHGAGTVVPWDQVRDHMHVDSGWRPSEQGDENSEKTSQEDRASGNKGPGLRSQGKEEPRKESWKEERTRILAGERELQEIFARTFPSANKTTDPAAARTASPKETVASPGRGKGDCGRFARPEGGTSGRRRHTRPEREYLLVDGYNIIFAWEELKDLAAVNLASARDRLMDILSNYQGCISCTLILVFDAYKVPGGCGQVMKYHNIYVVYTKEAETADQYIEKTVHKIGRGPSVTVATSDALEQVIILGGGALRLSANGLKEEIQAAAREMRQICSERSPGGKNYLLEGTDADLADRLEALRLGQEKS